MTEIVIYLDLKADENYRQLLRYDLAKAISRNQTGEISDVDLSVIMTFTWDKLFIFGPYTSPKKIDTILGRFWLGSRFTDIEGSDQIALLMFTKNGRVIQYLKFPRNQGDFSMSANETGYTFEESRFTVDGRGGMIWVGNK